MSSRPGLTISPSPAPSSSHYHHRTEPSTGTPREEGYPSWLPRRPPPPAPASTIQSLATRPPTSASVDMPVATGRKPTPRSVRIVSMAPSIPDATATGVAPGGRRMATDPPRQGHNRVWSRATAAAMSPTLFSESPIPPTPIPRFNAPALKLDLLRSPSWKSRLRFILWPFVVFAHIPIQAFFDFNTVFTIIQVAQYPTPLAPGVPGSGSTWALAAVAYFVCFFAWFFGVLIFYEAIFSFYRRWRVKRPLMIPIYFSTPAYNYVSLTSYTNFCFLRHLRKDAFRKESGSWRDGLAETFWFYSQNLPTIALLLPRAFLSLALLLAYSSSQPPLFALANMGAANQRDTTYFNTNDGSLSGYAKGVLIAHCVWALWRTVVLFGSWIGLWIMSGQACAGLCGPRYRWEEPHHPQSPPPTNEKASSPVSAQSLDPDDEDHFFNWEWRMCTRERILEAYEFCLTSSLSVTHNRGPSGKKLPASKRERSDTSDTEDEGRQRSPFAALEQVLMSSRAPGRVALSSHLFERPSVDVDALEDGLQDQEHRELEDGQISRQPTTTANSPTGTGPRDHLSSIIPPIVELRERTQSEGSGPLLSLPYPFPSFGPEAAESKRNSGSETKAGSGGKSKSNTGSGSRSKKSSANRASVIPFPTPMPSAPTTDAAAEALAHLENAEPENLDDDDDEGAVDDDDTGVLPGELGQGPASNSDHGTGSMSSLGVPINNPRYPFGYRRPVRSRASRSSRGAASSGRQTRGSAASSEARTNSFSGRPSMDSGGPHSPTSLANSSPSGAIGIPPPPRHPRGRRRTAGSGGSGSSMSPPPQFLLPTFQARALQTMGQSSSNGINRRPIPADAVPPAQPHGGRRRMSAPVDSGSALGSPEPEAMYESSEGEDEDNTQRHPIPRGHQRSESEEGEDAEREDSVGLLSNAPSPRTSLAALRQRANSLTGGLAGRLTVGSHSSVDLHRRSRTGTDASANSHERSAAHSIIQSHSGSSDAAGSRSRLSSHVESVGSPRSDPRFLGSDPQSHIDSELGSPRSDPQSMGSPRPSTGSDPRSMSDPRTSSDQRTSLSVSDRRAPRSVPSEEEQRARARVYSGGSAALSRGSGAPGSRGSRTYSDAQSSSGPRSSAEGPGEHTFGIQVPWRGGAVIPSITTSLAQGSAAPPGLPATRSPPRGPAAASSGMGVAGGSGPRPRVQSDLSAIAPSERTVAPPSPTLQSRTQTHPNPTPNPAFGGSSPQLTVPPPSHAPTSPQAGPSSFRMPTTSLTAHPNPSTVSTANQSFVTNAPTLEGATTTEDDSHGAANTWGRHGIGAFRHRSNQPHMDDHHAMGPRM